VCLSLLDNGELNPASAWHRQEDQVLSTLALWVPVASGLAMSVVLSLNEVQARGMAARFNKHHGMKPSTSSSSRRPEIVQDSAWNECAREVEQCHPSVSQFDVGHVLPPASGGILCTGPFGTTYRTVALIVTEVHPVMDRTRGPFSRWDPMCKRCMKANRAKCALRAAR
jgi:hypothetical protein